MQFKTMSMTRKLSVILAIAGVILIIGHELELYLPDLELGFRNVGRVCTAGFYRVICRSDTFFYISRYPVFCRGFIIFTWRSTSLYDHCNLSGLRAYFFSGPLCI